MGGTVAVTIRKEDDTYVSMSRFTGSYNLELFFTKEFYHQDYNGAINNYISKMKNYDSFSDFSPESYGLVFIDFKDKEIYTLQDYDLPGHLLIMELLAPHYKQHPQYEHLVELYKSNQLVYMDNLNQYINLKEYLKNTNKLDKVDNIVLDKNYKAFHEVALSSIEQFTENQIQNWKIFALENRPCDYIQYMKAILSKGHIFNENEIDSWKIFLEESTDYIELPDEVTSEQYVGILLENLLQKQKYNKKM